MANAWEKHRKAALREDPHCQRCGIEHGSEVGSYLHWHHVTPRHTGQIDHSHGVLLCPQCHQAIHRQHKNVSIDGYTMGAVPLPERRAVKNRKERAQRISDAYAD